MHSEIDLNIILNGNTEISLDQSKDMLSAVQVFITDSNIFN
jgi:hypothetical protein